MQPDRSRTFYFYEPKLGSTVPIKPSADPDKVFDLRLISPQEQKRIEELVTKQDIIKS